MPKVAHYDVLGRIGAGAQGDVYLVHDPRLQRRVALKLLRRGTDREGIAEARALAQVVHPNVVPVFDAGIIGSRAYIVMEYVEGRSLGEWCERTTSWMGRLRMIVEVGRGLQAVHAAGIVHADFKPSNVIVGRDGRPRVMDFGLARLTTESSRALTGGTPGYRAPECEDRPADAQSDQYSYCVTASRLLVGLPRAAVPQSVAAVIERGLSTNPRERWPSMSALLDALTTLRSRSTTPVLVGLGALGVLGFAIVDRTTPCSGSREQLVEVWDDARRDAVGRAMLGTGAPHADEAWARTRADLDAYADAWASMHRETCEATTVRGDQPVEVMDLRMACLHRMKLRLRATTDVLADADADAITNAHRLVGALPEVDRCADVESLASGSDPLRSNEAAVVAAARALLARAEAERDIGWYARAEQTLVATDDVLQGIEHPPIRIELALANGELLDHLGRYAEAEAVLVEAFEAATLQGDAGQMQAAATVLLTVVGIGLGRVDEALQRYADPATSLRSNDARMRAAASWNLAQLLLTKGSYAEAEDEHRKAMALYVDAVGHDHPDIAIAHLGIARCLAAQGRHAEAEVEHRTALALRERVLGPDHPFVGAHHNELGNILRVAGKYDEAETEAREGLEITERAFFPEHPDVAAARGNLAAVLTMKGSYEEAETEQRQVLASFERALGPEHPVVGISHNNLGNILRQRGKYEEAEVEHRRALEVRVRALGPDHASVAESHANLANVLVDLEQYEEAEVECRTALMLRERALGPDHPEVAVSSYNLAGLLLARGRPSDALAPAERAWRLSERDDVPLDQRSDAQALLARVLWETAADRATRRRAVALAREALDGYTRSGDAWRDVAGSTQQWLQEHRTP